MPVLENDKIEKLALPGLVHQTLAGPRSGLKEMEVWMQSVSPGAATPMHRHACEEVIVVLAGAGVCEMDGQSIPFGPGSTLIVTPNAVHRITSTGPEELRIIAALSAAPVAVETPDGARIHLPWDQDAG
jgi:mannose-6-phosphate isomerase-like protein (cupin superfamily)